VLRRNALLAAAHPGRLAALFELFDRRCHPAIRPHLRLVEAPSTRTSSGQSGGMAIAALHHGRIYINFDQRCGTGMRVVPFNCWATHATEV